MLFTKTPSHLRQMPKQMDVDVIGNEIRRGETKKWRYNKI